MRSQRSSELSLELGSLLNSVINVEYSVFLLHGLNKGYPGDLLLKLGGNWILVNVGNFIGSLTTAGLLTYSQVFKESDKERLEVILEAKLKVRVKFQSCNFGLECR